MLKATRMEIIEEKTRVDCTGKQMGGKDLDWKILEL